MLIKLDENLPPAVADLLRGASHDVKTVYEQGLRSRADPDVLAVCQSEGRALISLDLDFSNILQFPPERFAGLIVLRIHKPGKRAVLSLMQRLIPHFDSASVAGRLWIVDEHHIRVHLVGGIDLGPDVRETPLP
jgi:predicted nuclease of predicted toxin-antitoxin system